MFERIDWDLPLELENGQPVTKRARGLVEFRGSPFREDADPDDVEETWGEEPEEGYFDTVHSWCYDSYGVWEGDYVNCTLRLRNVAQGPLTIEDWRL